LLLGYKVGLKDVTKNFVIDEKGLDRATSKDIVVPVHLFGFPAPMGEIMKKSKEIGFTVIEDCAQAHGTTIKNKRVGSFGLAGIYSFYPSHNVQAGGELGCIVTNSKDLVDKIKMIKDNGRDVTRERFNHVYLGFNAKANEFSAAMALEQAKSSYVIQKARYKNCKIILSSIKK